MPITKFNRTQLRAINYGLSPCPGTSCGPVVVLAGPGTGKTRLIAGRANRLLETGISPSRILGLVFGSRAAQELRDRVPEQKIRIGTFHSVGAQMIRCYAGHVGLDKSFSILDKWDSSNLLGDALAQLSRKESAGLPDRDTCLQIYSLWVNFFGNLGRVLSNRFPAALKYKSSLEELFGRYEASKLKANSADFDDLLRLWFGLLQDQKIGPEIRNRFDHVLVDEYQDTGPLQAQIVLALAPKGQGLFVVGDDAQCIYSFRGASFDNILDLCRQSPGVAKIIKLRRNYRSTSGIVAAYNAITSRALQGVPKELVADRRSKRLPQIQLVDDAVAEARLVACLIQRRQREGIPLRDQAVLFREYAQVTRLSKELQQRNIPFRMAGNKHFLETGIIRDAVAIMRWGLNYRDRTAALRTLQLLPDVTANQAERIFDRSAAHAGVADQIPNRARRAWKNLRLIMARVQVGSFRAKEALAAIEAWLDRFGVRTAKPTRGYRKSLKQLRTMNSNTSCRAFIDSNVLDQGSENYGIAAKDRLTLSTVHAAKGREWRFVMIMSATDGNMPSRFTKTPQEYEEERRLFGVAISRAKDDLRLFCPRRLPSKHHRRVTPFISRQSVAHFKILRSRPRQL